MEKPKMYTFYFRTLMYNKLGVDAPSYEAAYRWARGAGHTIEAYKGFEEILPFEESGRGQAQGGSNDGR